MLGYWNFWAAFGEAQWRPYLAGSFSGALPSTLGASDANSIASNYKYTSICSVIYSRMILRGLSAVRRIENELYAGISVVKNLSIQNYPLERVKMFWCRQPAGNLKSFKDPQRLHARFREGGM